MHQRSTGRSSTLRRISLLAASFALGVTGWFLLGESESLTAAESSGPRVLARLDGFALTEDRVMELAADELRALDQRRQELISQTARDEIHRRLIEMEAARSGLTSEELLRSEVEASVDGYQSLIARLEKSYAAEYLTPASEADLALSGKSAADS